MIKLDDNLLAMFVFLSFYHTTLQFNDHFPGGPGSAGTRMSPFWISLGAKMMEVVSGDNRKTCKAPVKLLPPTNQHPDSYYRSLFRI